MALIKTMYVSDMHHAFETMGRAKQFSYQAREALYDHLNELSEDIGEPIELDVIGICCDYSEFDSAIEAASEHGWVNEIDPDEYRDDEDDHRTSDDMIADMIADQGDYFDDVEESALDWLNERTSVITFDSGVVIQAF